MQRLHDMYVMPPAVARCSRSTKLTYVGPG